MPFVPYILILISVFQFTSIAHAKKAKPKKALLIVGAADFYGCHEGVQNMAKIIKTLGYEPVIRFDYSVPSSFRRIGQKKQTEDAQYPAQYPAMRLSPFVEIESNSTLKELSGDQGNSPYYKYKDKRFRQPDPSKMNYQSLESTFSEIQPVATFIIGCQGGVTLEPIQSKLDPNDLKAFQNQKCLALFADEVNHIVAPLAFQLYGLEMRPEGPYSGHKRAPNTCIPSGTLVPGHPMTYNMDGSPGGFSIGINVLNPKHAKSEATYTAVMVPEDYKSNKNEGLLVVVIETEKQLMLVDSAITRFGMKGPFQTPSGKELPAEEMMKQYLKNFLDLCEKSERTQKPRLPENKGWVLNETPSATNLAPSNRLGRRQYVQFVYLPPSEQNPYGALKVIAKDLKENSPAACPQGEQITGLEYPYPVYCFIPDGIEVPIHVKEQIDLILKKLEGSTNPVDVIEREK